MRDTVDVAKDVAWWLEVETSFFLLEDGAHRLAQLYNIIGEGSTVQVARHFFGLAEGLPDTGCDGGKACHTTHV